MTRKHPKERREGGLVAPPQRVRQAL